MTGFSEDIVEYAAIKILKDLGWNYLHGMVIAPDSAAKQIADGARPNKGRFSLEVDNG